MQSTFRLPGELTFQSPQLPNTTKKSFPFPTSLTLSYHIFVSLEMSSEEQELLARISQLAGKRQRWVALIANESLISRRTNQST